MTPWPGQAGTPDKTGQGRKESHTQTNDYSSETASVYTCDDEIIKTVCTHSKIKRSYHLEFPIGDEAIFVQVILLKRVKETHTLSRRDLT